MTRPKDMFVEPTFPTREPGGAAYEPHGPGLHTSRPEPKKLALELDVPADVPGELVEKARRAAMAVLQKQGTSVSHGSRSGSLTGSPPGSPSRSSHSSRTRTRPLSPRKFSKVPTHPPQNRPHTRTTP